MQRTKLSRLLTLSLTLLLTAPLAAQEVAAQATVEVNADSVVKYVMSCRKPNGAFGPVDQEYTDAAWNFPAVTILGLFEILCDRPEAILEHGGGGPLGHGGGSHRQFCEHHLLRAALDLPIKPRFSEVEVYHQGFKRNYYMSPFGNDGDLLFKDGSRVLASSADIEADTFYYYNLSSLSYLLGGLESSGRKPKLPQPLIDYILRHQTSTGGFADGGDSGIGEAHVVHTVSAMAALKFFGAPIPNPEKVEAFLKSCRDKQGGYRWNPKVNLPGNEPDVYYTFMALAGLNGLKATPEMPELTKAWLNSLQNADGGFGDRPGWRSRLASTMHAVVGLQFLERNVRNAITTKQLPVPKLATIPAGKFQIYQAQFKVPIVKPDELAGLHQRGFNLLGLKSYDFADAERLLDAIKSQKLPMDVVLCPEMYPHRLTQLGATLNHVGNFTLDARWNAEQRAEWAAADAAGREYPTWATYRDKVIAPVRKLGGFAYPEQDFEMEYAYIAYDSGLSSEAGRDGKGYNAVLVGFNWPPKDFVRVFPWHERYTDRLTPIADVDAHGDLTKWSEQLDTVRTLFIAKGPTYADFQEAAAAGRVVSVIAQPEGVASGASYYGPAAAVEYVKRHRTEWQWWK